jgi:hypothetical protein
VDIARYRQQVSVPVSAVTPAAPEWTAVLEKI